MIARETVNVAIHQADIRFRLTERTIFRRYIDRSVRNGAERADSLVVNPHKWMGVPIDLSVLYTRKPEIFKRAFSLVPEFLRTAEDSRVVNYMDYGVPLGRRPR